MLDREVNHVVQTQKPSSKALTLTEEDVASIRADGFKAIRKWLGSGEQATSPTSTTASLLATSAESTVGGSATSDQGDEFGLAASPILHSPCEAVLPSRTRQQQSTGPHQKEGAFVRASTVGSAISSHGLLTPTHDRRK